MLILLLLNQVVYWFALELLNVSVHFVNTCWYLAYGFLWVFDVYIWVWSYACDN